MKFLVNFLFVVLMVTIGVGLGEAKTDDFSEKERPVLEEVVVTATKIPEKQENVTQKVDSIDEEDSKRMIFANRNISEMFQYQPGTFISVLSRNDANWGSYGGLGPRYNAYLLDGLPIDSFVDTMSLDLAAFERGEVQRGPASVMYSNYMTMDFAGNQSPLAGTTNLILKDKIEESATRIALGYGSYDTYGGRIYHQDHRGNFHYFMGGSYEASDYANYGTSDSWLNMIDDPEYEKSKLYLKTSYFFGREDHKISLFGHHTRHDGDAGRPNRDYHHIYDTVNVAYSNQFSERFNGQVKIGYRSYDRNWEEDNYPVDLGLRSKDGVKQQIIPMDATLSFKHFKNSLLTFGMDYQDVEYNTFSETQGISQTGNDMTASSTGLFAEEKIGWGNWIFRIGNRYNYIQHDYTRISGTTPEETEKSWDKILWSAGARCAVSPSVSIYANAGTSYQAPSAKSVGGTLKESDRGVPGRNGQLPNPDLKPESGIGSDLGLDVKLGNQWVLGLRGFYNQIEDAIVENRISENPSQSRSVNAGTTDAYGLEVEIKYRMNTRLEWFANYTLVETDVKNDVDTDQDGSNVPFVPDYTANIGLTAFLPYDISASAYVKAVGKYFDSTSKTGRKSFGPYEVVNFVLQKKLWNTEQHRSFLRLELNNLLDERFEMPWQFQDPGFASFLSWQIEF